MKILLCRESGCEQRYAQPAAQSRATAFAAGLEGQVGHLEELSEEHK